MADIVMPRLSDSMEEGTILRWLKSVGDEVAVGDELVEIETDKANMVYEADAGRHADRDRGRGGRHAADRRGDRAGRGWGGQVAAEGPPRWPRRSAAGGRWPPRLRKATAGRRQAPEPPPLPPRRLPKPHAAR